MKHYVLAVLLLFALGVSAAAQDQEQLKKKLDDKKAAAWIKKNGWITDYDAAREAAKKSGKLIFAYFTRSYAY